MKKRLIALRLVTAAAAVAVLALFAYGNAGQWVDLNFGLFVIRGISLPILLYGAVIVGMSIMLVVGLRSDLRTRDALKRYDEIAADVLRSIDSPEVSSDEERVVERAPEKT